MIKCPYCQNELPDEALTCSQCHSLLVESEKAGLPKSKKLTTWGYLTHPWAALGYLIILSSLILLGFQWPFSRKPVSSPAPGASQVAQAPESQPAPNGDLEEPSAPGTEEFLGEPEIQVPERRLNRGNRDRTEMKGLRGKRSRGKRAAPDVASYEQEVKGALAQADQLVEKFNEAVRQSGGKAGSQNLNDILSEFRDLLQQMRSLEPPAGFERCQTTLSNSIALTRRGLRSKLLYLETGESAQLNEGQKDLETARQQREQGLSLLESIKQDLAAGKPVKPAPPAGPPPPEPAKPAESPPQVSPPPPPPAQPPAAVTPPEPEPEPEPEYGETLDENIEEEEQPEDMKPGPSEQQEEPWLQDF